MTAAAQPVAVVTGTASGIGKAVAADLIERGWAVAGMDRAPSPDCTTWAQVDVTDERAVTSAVHRAQHELGAVTAAVSVAGYYEMTPVAHITREAWRGMLRVHLGGFIHLARAALPSMVSRAGGSLVAISSELAVGGGSEDVHYTSAKGALIGAARSLAVEMAPHGVRVNVVAPGPTDTPLLPPDSPWRAPDYLRTLPLGRLVHPQEVARCVRFLVDEGTFCVGEVLNPNAGAVI
jgi:2-hydroxycyclohexanecarboxyl-CoA dehydrogenase